MAAVSDPLQRPCPQHFHGGLQCEDVRTLTSPPPKDAEYCIINSEAAVSVPEHLDAATYAPILCAGLTIFNSIRHMDVPAGSTIAVQGLGGLGHLAVQYANKLGHRVVAISRGDDKEAFARELGAHKYIDASKVDPGETLQKLGGAALAITTAPSAETMPGLLAGLGIRGKLLILSGKTCSAPRACSLS